MSSLDWLVAKLDEQQATSFDIRASPEELVEEINLGEYIQSMLIAASLEVRVAVSTVPLAEPTLSPCPPKGLPVPTVDRGKGAYVLHGGRNHLHQTAEDYYWRPCCFCVFRK